MFYFLQAENVVDGGIKSVDAVKEKLVEEKGKLAEYVDSLYDKVVFFVPTLISALVVLLIGLWLIKRIAKLAEKAMVKKDLEISLRTFLKSLISVGLKIVLIVTVAGMLGIGTTSFVTILGAAGLAIGLALQGSLANFAGGVLILIFKPFKVGDGIEAQGQSGEVIEIQIFNTILLTGDHKTVILPNGPLSNGSIVNTTRHGDLRIDISLAIGIENDLEKVERIIRDVLSKNELILQSTPPLVLIGKQIKGAVEINVKPFCKASDTAKLSSSLYRELKEAFEKNKITSPIEPK